MRTLEQKRMQAAWETLKNRFPMEADYESWNKDKKEAAKRYLTAVKKTAARIHTSGLGQALAFLNSRGKDESRLACQDISALTLRSVNETGTDLLGKIMTWDMSLLFHATGEAMAVCDWLARYLAGVGVSMEENEE